MWDTTITEDGGNFNRVKRKYIWNEDLHGQYLNSLNIKEKSFRELNLHLAAATTSRQIDENIEQFSELMTEICDPLFSKNIKSQLTDECKTLFLV